MNMVKRYFAWCTTDVKVPYWLLLTIIEFAILGAGWYCKTVSRWYDYDNKPSKTSES